MFQKIVTSALLAGFGAGLLAALLQFVFMQPVLLHAELYETGQLTHFGAETTASHGFERTFDLTRDILTVLFTTIVYVGYALLMLAIMAFAIDRGHSITPRAGIIWGIAGFIAVQMAPAFSLAPELPGMAAADVGVRQVRWFATVAAAIIALWLIGYGKNPVAWAIAIVLLLAPHIIGAPMPDILTGPAPPELASEFATRALGVGLAAWATMGLFAAYFWGQDDDS